MKIWKLIALLLLTTCVAACDDDTKGEENGGNAGGTSADQVNVGFGYDARTVLRNAGQVLVPVKLEKKVNNLVKVTVDARKGDSDTDAREGIDFNIAEKVVTVPVGDTIAMVAVDLLDNQKADDNRVITLNITGVYGGKVGTQSSCALHIVSNAFVEFENTHWETYESSSSASASEEIRNSRFVPLAITGEVTEASTLVLGVIDSTAVEPTHFTVQKEVTVQPGDTRVLVEVTTVDDDLINNDRVFTLYVKEVKGGNLLVGKTAQSCQVKIKSEEMRRNLTFGVTSAKRTDKEQELLIPVSLDKEPDAPVTVKIVSTAASTAQEGRDYELLTKEVTLNNTTPTMVKVKILGDKDLNADRRLVLSFIQPDDKSIFFDEQTGQFTLDIFNDDMEIEETAIQAEEDAVASVKIHIPAVDRERTLTLAYKTTEKAPGTYFVQPAVKVKVPANENNVTIPMNVKYTTDFPAVAPVFTISIIEMDEYELEEPLVAQLTLAQCSYRKLLGNYKDNQGNACSMTISEWKKELKCAVSWNGWNVSLYYSWNEDTKELSYVVGKAVYPDRLNFGGDLGENMVLSEHGSQWGNVTNNVKTTYTDKKITVGQIGGVLWGKDGTVRTAAGNAWFIWNNYELNR